MGKWAGVARKWIQLETNQTFDTNMYMTLTCPCPSLGLVLL